MKKNEIDTKLAKLKAILEADPKVLLTFVFGSFAHYKAKKTSDLDLAIAMLKPMTPDEKVTLITHLSSKLKIEIDLVDLNTATGTVFKEALTNGKILIKKDTLLLSKIIKRLIYNEEDFEKKRKLLLSARRKRAFHVT